MKSSIIKLIASDVSNIYTCQCSACEKDFAMDNYDINFIKYCPICGAKIIRINRQ